MNQIARFYESNLKNAPQAVEYLKGRGLTGEVVKRFNIGYAPGDWDQVRRRFGASRDHEQLLISGGMLIPVTAARQLRSFPRSHHVSDPGQTRSGHRLRWPSAGDGTPKYLNSPKPHLPQGARAVRPL